MADVNTRNRILKTLEHMPAVTEADIGVAVHEGVVTLTGVVPHDGHKAMIECAVLMLPEVRGLVQKIHVSADSDFLDSDEQIALRMVRMIEWNLAKPDEDIRVRVEQGRVTLTGHVGCSEDREKAEQFPSLVRGCVGFANHLVVKHAVGAATVASEETAP